MLTKTRSDFWKCACWIGAIMEACGAINAGSDAQCQECGYDWSAAGTEYTPATNVEVLIAWLSADDERRKEIEIASTPDASQHGKYVAWRIGKDGEPTIVPSHYRVGPNHVENPKEWLADYRYFWEPIE